MLSCVALGVSAGRLLGVCAVWALGMRSADTAADPELGVRESPDAR